MFKTLNRQLEVLTLKFLNQLMDRGHHQWVYTFSDYWGRKGGIDLFLPFYSASWSVQKRLIEEFSYPECPSCMWSTKVLQEHFEESSACRAQSEWEDKEDERIWHEIYEHDEWLREDNEYPD